MELTDQEKQFLLEVLDKIQVQGIANNAAVINIFQKLQAQLAASKPAAIEEIKALMVETRARDEKKQSQAEKAAKK